jgi:hypothetical protein
MTAPKAMLELADKYEEMAMLSSSTPMQDEYRTIAAALRSLPVSDGAGLPDLHEPTDAMIEAAAREVWNDLYFQHGGSWDGRGANEICVIQLKATMRAALQAALSLPSAGMEGRRGEIARTLYECEKRRAEHCQSILQKASGKECPGAAMEPWEECCEVFLSDADAILALCADTRPDGGAP